jgi:hypothetical protein
MENRARVVSDQKRKSTEPAGYDATHSTTRALAANCLTDRKTSALFRPQYDPIGALFVHVPVEKIPRRYLPANRPFATCCTCRQGANRQRAFVTVGLDHTAVAAAAVPEIHGNPAANFESGASD